MEGSTELYVFKLSQMFFGLLRSTCHEFAYLFDNSAKSGALVPLCLLLAFVSPRTRLSVHPPGSHASLCALGTAAAGHVRCRACAPGARLHGCVAGHRRRLRDHCPHKLRRCACHACVFSPRALDESTGSTGSGVSFALLAAHTQLLDDGLDLQFALDALIHDGIVHGSPPRPCHARSFHPPGLLPKAQQSLASEKRLLPQCGGGTLRL
jgi:hypothetical protein